MNKNPRTYRVKVIETWVCSAEYIVEAKSILEAHDKAVIRDTIKQTREYFPEIKSLEVTDIPEFIEQ